MNSRLLRLASLPLLLALFAACSTPRRTQEFNCWDHVTGASEKTVRSTSDHFWSHYCDADMCGDAPDSRSVCAASATEAR